jgi:hypothetical protein
MSVLSFVSCSVLQDLLRFKRAPYLTGTVTQGRHHRELSLPLHQENTKDPEFNKLLRH